MHERLQILRYSLPLCILYAESVLSFCIAYVIVIKQNDAYSVKEIAMTSKVVSSPTVTGNFLESLVNVSSVGEAAQISVQRLHDLTLCVANLLKKV